MEGRVPTGIYVVFANCTDPAKEAALNQWYNNTHIPDITQSGIFTNTTRYVNPTAKGAAEAPKYLAIYETYQGDPAAAWAENRKTRHQWSDAEGLRAILAAVLMGCYVRIEGTPSPPAGRRTKAILVSMSDCADPAREGEYNAWYNEVHVPEVLGTGLYWTATRFMHPNPETGQPKYMAVYETEEDGAAALAKLAQGRLDPGPGLSRRRLTAPFNLIFSQAAAKAGARASRA